MPEPPLLTADDPAELLQVLADNAIDMVTRFSPDLICRYTSPATTALLGWASVELRGIACEELMHPDDRDAAGALFAAFPTAPETATVNHRLRHKDGHHIWVESTGRAIRDEHGTLLEIQTATRDTTPRRAAERQQAVVARLGQVALEGRDLGALVDDVLASLADTLEVEYALAVKLHPDEDVLDMIGATGVRTDWHAAVSYPVLPNTQLSYLFATNDPVIVEDLATETRFSPAPLLVEHGVTSCISVAIPGTHRSYGAIGIHTAVRRTFSVDDVHFLTAVANLLAAAIRRHDEEELSRHAARHDALTGLPNRRQALDRIDLALGRRAHDENTVGVLMIDLDRFKVINDSLGHAAGDELLLTLAPRLRAALGPSDLVARLGGDEFVVVCDAPSSPHDVVEVAERLAAAVAQPLVLGSGEHFISASIGIAVASAPTDTAESLLRDADAAMYRAKDRGPGRYELFDDAMREQVTSRLRIEAELRRALDLGELRTFYQPILDAASGVPVGVEALVRWEHPERGLVPPLDFIPIAEETGLIIELGRWVLQDASAQGARWQQKFGIPLEISVNLSGHQLANPLFPAQAAEIARTSGLLPGTLKLEVTESVLMEEAETPVALLQTLREHGLRLVLDDFGTGYSSLSYLRHFPLDGLKIDRAFVNGLGDNAMDSAIVRAVMEMSRAGGMTVVAEGVETAEQLEHLRELGCGHVQGYYFSRPLPADRLDDYLTAQFAPR